MINAIDAVDLERDMFTALYGLQLAAGVGPEHDLPIDEHIVDGQNRQLVAGEERDPAQVTRFK